MPTYRYHYRSTKSKRQCARSTAAASRELTEFHGIDPARTHLLAGRTHEELPALAARLRASLVIMGAVARNRLKHVFIGATAERTLESLPCDLLIVKPDWFQSAVELRNQDLA